LQPDGSQISGTTKPLNETVTRRRWPCMKQSQLSIHNLLLIDEVGAQQVVSVLLTITIQWLFITSTLAVLISLVNMDGSEGVLTVCSSIQHLDPPMASFRDVISRDNILARQNGIEFFKLVDFGSESPLHNPMITPVHRRQTCSRAFSYS
jgi:hypothetical protein